MRSKVKTVDRTASVSTGADPSNTATVREQILGLVAKAYECIKMADAVKYFGMPEDILLQELTSEGWKYEPSSNAFYPTTPGNVDTAALTY